MMEKITMIDELQIEDEYVIENPETLKILGDPLRIRILEQVSRLNETGQLATAKLLAESLDVPQTKLYYHLNLLEQHELLRVAETGLVSGIVEKRYQIRAHRFRADVDIEPEAGVAHQDEIETIMAPISSVVNNALRHARESIQHHIQIAPDEGDEVDDEDWQLIQRRLFLSQDEAKQFNQRFLEMLEEFSHPSDGEHQLYYLTILFHPTPPTRDNSQES
jgi:DNA-binding transcriptional ArsR family regulator